MKPRIIICEGVDGSGKSTLAKQIAKHYRGVYWHMTSGKGLCEHDAMSLYQRDALHNAEKNIENGLNVVFDRHWPSDQVYGTVLRGRPSIPIEDMAGWCQDMGAIYIYCYRDNPIEEHEKVLDPDHPYDRDLFAKLVQGYEEFFSYANEHKYLGLGRVLGYPTDYFINKPEQTIAFMDGLVHVQ